MASRMVAARAPSANVGRPLGASPLDRPPYGSVAVGDESIEALGVTLGTADAEDGDAQPDGHARQIKPAHR